METLEATTIPTIIAWPPEYTLRISKKAKRVNLRILPQQGLEIIVPFRQQKYIVIADVLNEFKGWIEKHLAKLEVKPKVLVTELNLRAIQQKWQIQYQKTFSSQLRHSVCMGTEHNTLTIFGAIDDIDRTHICLQKWIKQLAIKHLVPWLQQLSVQHDLPFNKVILRAQQTLWGSCNHAKTISLNYKMLFMPPEHVTHIMLHELCHTKYLNHSNRFWNLLRKLDPACDAHDNAIRHGEKFVPEWFN